MQDLNKIQVSANEILPGLFLGNYAASQSEDFVRNHNITNIVNCSKDIPCKFKHVQYMRIPIDDPGYGQTFTNDHKIFLEMLDEVYTFITKNLNNGKNVLVHCHAGMQRSASVVIYCLMMLYKIEPSTQNIKKDKYNAVVAYVQSKRPIIYHYGQYNNFFPAFKRILNVA